jgi:DNA-binding HxlR family transcriptional regulator
MKNSKTAQLARRKSLSDIFNRGELLSANCPSREVLKHLTSRWGVLVLIVLLTGTHRFSDLRRKIGGVSERMLAQTLQWLEADGIVDRKAYPVVPPHVDYTLTPLGRAAAKQVRGLADWIEVSMPEIAEGWDKDRAA